MINNYDFNWYKLLEKGKNKLAQKREVFQGKPQKEQHQNQVDIQEQRNKVYRISEEQLTNRKFTFNV